MKNEFHIPGKNFTQNPGSTPSPRQRGTSFTLGTILPLWRGLGVEKPFQSWILLISLLLPLSLSAQSDVILQGFYWNSHPGDVSDNVNGGIWWDSLAQVAPEIGFAGFQSVWIPPANKGIGGRWDMGYGIKDYYDFGDFNQNGSVRTRHGNLADLQAMIAAYHAAGVKVMADIVLNHRGGADAQNQAYDFNAPPFNGIQPWTVFNPASGRFPGDSSHFHPTQFHQDQNAEYHNPLFFTDYCYFNNGDLTGPGSGWFFGPPNSLPIGSQGDSLIAWGRYMTSTMGIDELRLDAVKHIDPWFLAKFLVESNNGDQPFAVGESFDYDPNNLANYHNAVVTSPNSGSKSASLSLFDFPLRGTLKSILNDGSGNQDLYNQLGGAGLVWGSALSGFDVVTWIENHDTDRIGFEGGAGTPPCPPGEIAFGNSCLKIAGGSASDHDPIFQDKEDMGYPFIMAAEGRPTVFWKDWFWYGLNENIQWQMALRAATAQGSSDHIQNLNGFWPTDPPYDGDNNGGNMFVMTRSGLSGGTSDGMLLGLNDHPTKTNGVWVNSPFANRYVKDYSDAYLFETQQVYSDARTFVKAGPRDYSWYGLTGLYPNPPGEAPSHFTMDAQPGGSVHYIVLRGGADDYLIVNGGNIEYGDQVAVKNGNGEICGIGRIGQRFGWDGYYDMVIEVLGPFPGDADPTGGGANGMTVGEAFSFVVWDASMGQEVEARNLGFSSTPLAIDFIAARPNSPNRSANFVNQTATETGTFAANGISLLDTFIAGSGVDIEKDLTPSVSRLEIYPNPVGEKLTLYLELSQPELINLSLVNMSGQEFDGLFAGKLTAGSQQIELDVRAFPAGIYLLKVNGSEGVMLRRVLLVR